MRSGNDKHRGLYRKFEVRRTDGSSRAGGKHERCRYFVLDLDHDQFAPAAMRAYAERCAEQFPKLADDILAFLRGENVFKNWRPEDSRP